PPPPPRPPGDPPRPRPPPPRLDLATRPISVRRGPSAARAASESRPTKSPGLSSLTTRPSPASYGVTSGPSSLPYNGMPASRRSVSRAASPAAGRSAEEPDSPVQTRSQSPAAQKISKPSSPVYPVRATHAGHPATVPYAPA